MKGNSQGLPVSGPETVKQLLGSVVLLLSVVVELELELEVVVELVVELVLEVVVSPAPQVPFCPECVSVPTRCSKDTCQCARQVDKDENHQSVSEVPVVITGHLIEGLERRLL